MGYDRRLCEHGGINENLRPPGMHQGFYQFIVHLLRSPCDRSVLHFDTLCTDTPGLPFPGHTSQMHTRPRTLCNAPHTSLVP